MAEAITVSGPVSGTDKTLTLSTGVFAPQSQGAVVARLGDTQVLATANGAKEVREGTDFFPLTIDVEEKAYAAGKIPGSFFRKEGRPSDNAVLVCRLIDGKYPNYEAVIPKKNPNKLTIDRASFLSSIRRVSIFSNKTTHQVRLSIAGSQLAVSAEDLDFANEANEKLTCSYEGEDMTIGFNSRFLMDMLNNLTSEHVVLEMSAPNRAGIILPSEPGEVGEDVLMLVMPVMLNN